MQSCAVMNMRAQVGLADICVPVTISISSVDVHVSIGGVAKSGGHTHLCIRSVLHPHPSTVTSPDHVGLSHMDGMG